MTSQVQQMITKDLFQQNTERIKYVVQVTKPHKKKTKSTYFLAVVVNNQKNSHHLCLIKKGDSSERYQRDKTWNFDEIQHIDAKHENEEPEFEIVFSNKQSYKWLTNTANEKSSFLYTIKQITSQSTFYADITFSNMPNGDASFVNAQLDNISTSEKMDEPEWNVDDSYQALTSREEADLERLLALEVENTINNAEAFTEKLSRDLSSMDSSNIQDIMASEQRVSDLMNVLESAIDETLRLENKIVCYESLLKNVRDIVQKVEKKEAIVQIYNDNNNRLLNEVGQVISSMDFIEEYEDALSRCDLNSLNDLPKCIEAALKLQEAIQHEAPPTIRSLKGLQDQKAYLVSVSKHFGFRIREHINKLISRLVSGYQEKLTMKAHESVLSEHAKTHSTLIPYAPFMKWLREVDRPSYNSLEETYISNFSGIYEKEFSYFFEYLRDRFVYSSVKGNSIITPSPNEPKRKSLAVTDHRRNSYANSSQSDTVETASTRSSEISLTEWEEFDSYIEFMLKTIDPVCHAEQQFCNQFFDLEAISNLSIPSTPVLGKHGGNSETETSISNHSSNFSEHSASHAKRNEQLRNMLSELFRSFESEFIHFVGHYDKLDGIYSLYFLVRLNGHVMAVSDTGSFLSKAYGNILIHIKRSFDKYMQAQLLEIEEAKDPKRTKVGILPFIKRFETFARQTENVVKYGPQRRVDIDRWYVTLMEKIFQSIERIAKEHQRVYKTPSQMIELENYHYIQLMLPSLKIPCLENERKEAKLRYANALKVYVNLYFRRPLEKLNVFFEGVQQKVQQGIREEEISYQLAYSKQELRKVIKDCNLKDIKKGLEEMYKRVEKHISDPANNLIQASAVLTWTHLRAWSRFFSSHFMLHLQVIWRSMQEEFIAQYKSISEMIERCYPQANIALLFSIEDVLNVFSEIAQMHWWSVWSGCFFKYNNC